MFHPGGFVTLHVLVIKCRAWSGSKLFDTLMVFPKDFLKKMMVNLNDDDKKDANLTRTHSMARHRKSPRSQRNLMAIDPLTSSQGHQFDLRLKIFSVSWSTANSL